MEIKATDSNGLLILLDEREKKLLIAFHGVTVPEEMAKKVQQSPTFKSIPNIAERDKHNDVWFSQFYKKLARVGRYPLYNE